MPTLGRRPRGRPPSLAGYEHHPHLAPGGLLSDLQHVHSSLQVSLNPPSLPPQDKRSRLSYQRL